jgi:hypothetical protein
LVTISSLLGNINGSKNQDLLRLFPNGEVCGISANTIACDQPFWVHVAKHGTVTFSNKAQERYCRNGGLFSFHYVIFMARLVCGTVLDDVLNIDNAVGRPYRNPYDAIAKGYQRLCSEEGKATDFRTPAWISYARTAAAEYGKMWPRLQPSKHSAVIISLPLPYIFPFSVLSEMGSKLMVTRYEHLIDSSQWERVINALLVFHNRFPLSKEYITESFKAIDCLDKFPVKQQWDTIDMTSVYGEPYTDYRLIIEMSSKLDNYLSHFGYDAFPPGGNSAGPESLLAKLDEADLDYSILVHSSGNVSNCEILNASVSFGKLSIVETMSESPPLLISLPGMDNIWIRKLIEMSSGWYTGSLGEIDGSVDAELDQLFPGERYCGRRFSAINCGSPNFVHSGPKYSVSLDVKPHRVKCRKGVIHEFSKSILFVRNPYDAVVEAYLSEQEVNVDAVVPFDENWIQFAKDIMVEYVKMWDTTLQYLATAPADRVFIVKYEDLKNEVSRKLVMRNLLKFIGLIASDEIEFRVQTLREQCLGMHSTFSDLSSFTNLELESFPYDDKQFYAEVNQTLDKYFRAFGYDPVPDPVLLPGNVGSTVDKSFTIDSGVPVTKCMKLFDEIRYAPLQTSSTPPLLLSLPGSGSVYFRKLVELTTGWHTGSLGLIDGGVDLAMNDLFEGEKFCGRRFASINCPDPSFVHVTDKLSIALHVKSHRMKCRKGVIHEFTKSLILVRNPYDAMVSAYREQHQDGMSTADILQMNDNWIQFVRDSAEAYSLVWKQSFSPLVAAAQGSISPKVMVVKYEDLLVEETKLSVLRNLSLYLGSFGSGMNETEQLEREVCSMLTTTFRAYHEVNSLKFSDVPFDSALLQVIANNLDPYMTAFDYDILPNGALFGVRQVASTATKNNLEVDATLLPSPSGFLGIPSVLNMSYLKPLTEYSPELVLNGSLTKLQATLRCSQVFGYRSFTMEPRNTPLLLSFAGSGNTWVRMLIEFATSIYTGSTDTSDRVLKEEFVGENFCSPKTSVIKAHPPQLLLDQQSNKAVLVDELHKRKCDSHGMSGFNRYVFLVRDPYLAIFAEVNREITSSHIGAPTVDTFLQRDWYTLIINEARDYQSSWKSLVSGLAKNGRTDSMIFAQYEKLLDPQLRFQELFKIASFVSPEPGEVISLEKLQCAFIQSDVANVHRVKGKNSMNATYLYTNQSLVNELWVYLQDFATFAGYGKFVV